MKNPLLLGLLRNGLNFVGAWIIGHGLANAMWWETIAGMLLAGLGLVYGITTKDSIFSRVESFIRSSVSCILGFGVYKGWLTDGDSQALAASFATALISAWTVYANSHGIKPDDLKGILLPLTVPFLVVIAFGLAGCNQMTIDPAVRQRVDQGVASAAEKARVAFVQICNNYVAADALFDVAATVVKIPPKVVMAEDAAVGLIQRTCDANPQNAEQALAAVKDAWATVIAFRTQIARK